MMFRPGDSRLETYRVEWQPAWTSVFWVLGVVRVDRGLRTKCWFRRRRTL